MSPEKQTQAQFIEKAIKIHGNRFDYSKVEYINALIKVSIICKNHGEFLQTPGNHVRWNGCQECGITKKYTNEQLDKVLENRTIKRIDNYINSWTKIKFKCIECNLIWLCKPNSIILGSGCPICNDTKLSNEDIDEYLLKNNIKIKRLDNYINARCKIKWQCFNCNFIWSAEPSEIRRKGKHREGSGCPNCARGRNEKRVAEVLNLLKINFEKIKIELGNGRKIFPDFYLPFHNTIIEYNGIQHYQPTAFGPMLESECIELFRKQQERDELLRQYCNDKNIFLLEIDGRYYKGNDLKKFVFDYFVERVSYAR